MKGNPALPGGSLTSKPAWSITSGCSTTPAFFVCVGRRMMTLTRDEPMSYNKVQAAREFDRWSQGYDRCVLQRLLFGPSHRAIIARVRARSGERPLAILDVGCGTGVFASRIRAASPRSTVWGVDLVSAMLAQGKRAGDRTRNTSPRSRGTASASPSQPAPSTW